MKSRTTLVCLALLTGCSGGEGAGTPDPSRPPGPDPNPPVPSSNPEPSPGPDEDLAEYGNDEESLDEADYDEVPPPMAEAQVGRAPGSTIPLDDECDSEPDRPRKARSLSRSPRGSVASKRFWGGPDAELFRPRSEDETLLDWSYAGYHGGLDPIPRREANIVVKVPPGNVPSGQLKNLTAAIRAAIDEAREKDPTERVILLPPGRFELDNYVDLTSGVVLRGSGRDGKTSTTLYVRNKLRDRCGATGCYGGEPTQNNYANDHGYLAAGHSWNFEGAGTEITRVLGGPRRLTRVLRVPKGDASKLKVGDWVEVSAEGTSLLGPMYGNRVSHPSGGARRLNFPTRVSKILSSSTVCIERRLPLDLPEDSSPRLRPLPRDFEEIGIEDLTIEFDPSDPYEDHWDTEGRNAIYFHGVSNSWIRNVRIKNSENGVILRPALQVTVEDVILESTREGHSYRPRDLKAQGHWGLYMSNDGGDNLIQRFEVNQVFRHDVGSEKGARGNVVSEGRSERSLKIEHHGGEIYQSLWTDIDLGMDAPHGGGSNDNLLHNGGGPFWAAGWITLWNVHTTSRSPLVHPAKACNIACSAGKVHKDKNARTSLGFVDTIFVATPVNRSQDEADDVVDFWRTFHRDWVELPPYQDKRWEVDPRIQIEDIPGQDVYPQNLYHAQLARRHARVLSLRVLNESNKVLADLTEKSAFRRAGKLFLDVRVTSAAARIAVHVDGYRRRVDANGRVELPKGLSRGEHLVVVRLISRESGPGLSGVGRGYAGETFAKKFVVE